LNTADCIEEITAFGITPLIEFMDIFEDDIQEDLKAGSRESILWNEIKGKALMIRERAEKISRVRMNKKNSRMIRMERMLESLALRFEGEAGDQDAKIMAGNIRKVLDL
ncbi:MAG: hypothetical protein KKC20_23915, partial [Proteobacteria bacterium]|nr:hypothetical protein [Pseudomonadota bacterium]